MTKTYGGSTHKKETCKSQTQETPSYNSTTMSVKTKFKSKNKSEGRIKENRINQWWRKHGHSFFVAKKRPSMGVQTFLFILNPLYGHSTDRACLYRWRKNYRVVRCEDHRYFRIEIEWQSCSSRRWWHNWIVRVIDGDDLQTWVCEWRRRESGLFFNKWWINSMYYIQSWCYQAVLRLRKWGCITTFCGR